MPSRSACRACLVLAVLLALTLAACHEAPAPAAKPTPQVVVQVVQRRPVTLKTELPGRTSAYALAEVRPQVGGIIRERLFNEGASVRAGQVLYQIEPGPYQAALEQEQGALAFAQAAERIAQLLADRYRKLLPEKTISQQDYDNADAAYVQAQANVRLREAAFHAARINLQWTKVTAPIAGRTGRSLVTPGALVSASQVNPLTVVSRLDPIYVDVTQSSAELLRMRHAARAGDFTPGAPGTRTVSLVLEDGSVYPMEGRIQLTEVTVDSSTGAVALRAVFPNPDGLLLPGMYVRAVVTEGVDEHGILAPQEAVVRDRKGNATVRLVGIDNKVEVRDITATRVIGADWLVSAGLNPGDRLIVEGAQNARAGTAVQIVPNLPATAGTRPVSAAPR